MTDHWKSFLIPICLPAVVVFVARVVFQGFLFPIELSGDEAQYWDWSRHLQLSYHTKGPLIAWLIAGSTALLGDSELSIRLCSYIAHMIAGIAVGFLGMQLSGGSRRFVWLTSLGFQCIFAYQVAGSLMTVDMTMVAGWSVATTAAVTTIHKANEGKSVTISLILMGFGISLAFLAKYTALLGLLGILIGIWPQRKKLLQAPGATSGLLIASVLFVAGLAPVVIWNAARDWPTIQHLLGHLEIPRTAEDVRTWTEFRIRWPLTYLLQVLTVAGPLLTLLILLGVHQQRRDLAKNDCLGFRISFWSAIPVLVFYLIISLKGETEGNWTIGALASLTPFAAAWLDDHLSTISGRWIARFLSLRALLTLSLILTFPWSGALLQNQLNKHDLPSVIPLHRVQGHRQFATSVRQLAMKSLGPAGATAPIVCNYYDLTAIIAYSLPDHPIVYCASVSLGSRPSAYDDFIDTRFPQQHLLDKDLILVGASEPLWRDSLHLSVLRPLGSAIQRGRTRSIFHGKLKSLNASKER